MIDYAKNIESMNGLSEKERDFLVAYFCFANQSLKNVYKSGTNEYKYWHRWLKQHQYILYKVVNFSKVDLIKTSAEAFDYVLNQCIDIVENCSNKQSKTKLKALEVIQKICGLEQYAAASVQKLEENKRQSEIKQLTTEQLKQLAAAVSENVKRINSDTEAAAEDVEVLPGNN